MGLLIWNATSDLPQMDWGVGGGSPEVVYYQYQMERVCGN